MMHKICGSLREKEGKLDNPEIAAMKGTAEKSVEESSHFQCLEKTKGFSRLRTIQEIVGCTDKLITDDCLGAINTKTSLDNTKALDSAIRSQATENKDDLIPQTEIAIKSEMQDTEYVSLNVHMFGRSNSDGSLTYKKRKPNCYYGTKENDKNKHLPRQRVKSVGRRRTISQDEAGISESPVFFSSIGEWTVIDLNLNIFEKEDANRIFYLRMKRASYKEVEPEGIRCRIL
ncbi:uncharacterized protein [Montipora foliosa]|uniref:uncharacterized protein n=1 Tax=Montipora foliosa TaxID=591990 RepID=UPI0035F1379F